MIEQYFYDGHIEKLDLDSRILIDLLHARSWTSKQFTLIFFRFPRALSLTLYIVHSVVVQLKLNAKKLASYLVKYS